MSEPFVGQIALFPYDFAPRNWATCQGQVLPIQQYTRLFSLIGTYFGGNGTTTFALPDLQGRVAVGSSPTRPVGESGGVETVQITTDTLPLHSHGLNTTPNNGTVNTPAGSVLAAVFQGDLQGNGNQGNIYNPGAPDTSLVPASLVRAGTDNPSAHNNIQPSLVLRYCIALDGIFPARA